MSQFNDIVEASYFKKWFNSSNWLKTEAYLLVILQFIIIAEYPRGC